MSRKMRDRKAYMRTMEAFFAFFITFIFVVFVVLKGVGVKTPTPELDVLPALEQRDDFRDCVNAANATCIELLARPFIPAHYMIKVSIDVPEQITGAKDIYTETIFIVTNETGTNRIVYLYSWLLPG